MIVKSVVLVAIFLNAIIFEVCADNVQVTTNEGTILGKTSLSEKLNKTMYMFFGIPYAEPPNRFELSVPKSNWTGVLNCTSERDICLQTLYNVILGQVLNTIGGSEDCLFLNVITPNLTGRHPVLVWVHGGAFLNGNGSLVDYSPELLVEKGIVVVGIQYRLGAFGFLSTGDLTCPGNLGLKDQTLALQWVQRNIAHFGGDPTRVTIWGQSAGAASVALHLTSVRSKGLFSGAIMSSGTSLNLFLLSRKAVGLAYQIGTALGVGSSNSSELIENLKTVDGITLQNVSRNLASEIYGQYPLAGLLLAPVIEVPHPTAFLTVKSDHSLLSGKFTRVPVLTGYTSNEWAIIAGGIPDAIPIFNQDPTTLVPASIISNKNLTEAGLKIRKEFFGDVPNITMDNSLVHFYNVDQMIRPAERFVADVKKYVPNTYLYQFSYKGPNIEAALGYNFSGVVHSEDLFYLFKFDYLPYSKKDLAVRCKMVKMWSNFCKYRKPIPQPTSSLDKVVWLPASITPRPLLFDIDYKNR